MMDREAQNLIDRLTDACTALERKLAEVQP